MKLFHKRENLITENNNEDDFSNPVKAISITNIVASEIFQDMLKENGIPFICRQQGAGGYMKIVFGGGFVPDDIYVNAKDVDKARELYEVYLNTKITFEDNEE